MKKSVQAEEKPKETDEINDGRREKWAAGTLARCEGEMLSSEQSRIFKEETKSKEKEPGTHLQMTHFNLKDNSFSKNRFLSSAERLSGESSEAKILIQIGK